MLITDGEIFVNVERIKRLQIKFKSINAIEGREKL